MRRKAPLALLLLVLIARAASAQVAQLPNRSTPDAQRALTEYRAGWTSMSAEAFEEALASFNRALELDPTLNLAHYGAGRAYLSLHRYTEAIQALATCRDNYLAQAGRKFTGQNDLNRANEDRLTELRELQRQYQTGPQSNQSRDMMRLIDNSIRDTKNAASRGMNISIDASVPAFVSLSLGSAYFRAEQMQDAEREYKNAINTDSNLGEAHNNLAVIYYLSDRPTLALEEIKAAEKAGFRVNPDLKQRVKEATGR